MSKLRCFLFLLLALAGSAAAAGGAITGRVVAIHDGDTVTLLDQNRIEHRIRLAAIDAPEIGHGRNRPGQPYGEAAKRSLSELAYGRDAQAQCEVGDRYGRLVCTLWVGQVDVNIEQVKRGMAWVYRKYANDPAYYQAEAEARKARAGLWQDPSPVPPWDWRHR